MKKNRDDIPKATERRSGKNRRTDEGERKKLLSPPVCGKEPHEKSKIPGAPRREAGDNSFPGCMIGIEELEFLKAIDAYKTEFERPHPRWTEVFEVLIALGYRKVAERRRPARPKKL